jgi:hypothetical protein
MQYSSIAPPIADGAKFNRGVPAVCIVLASLDMAVSSLVGIGTTLVEADRFIDAVQGLPGHRRSAAGERSHVLPTSWVP